MRDCFKKIKEVARRMVQHKKLTRQKTINTTIINIFGSFLQFETCYNEHTIRCHSLPNLMRSGGTILTTMYYFYVYRCCVQPNPVRFKSTSDPILLPPLFSKRFNKFKQEKMNLKKENEKYNWQPYQPLKVLWFRIFIHGSNQLHT